jgi:hypothetical protein
VLLVARQQRQLDLGLRDREVHPLTVVLDRDDVHALLGDQREEPHELAGPVRNAGANDEVAAADRQAVAHDRDEQRGVDVPAGEDDRDWARGAAHLAGEQRRDADGAGALDHELGALEQEDDRFADGFVVDVHQVVEDVVEDRHRQVARLLHVDAVGNREAGQAGLDADDPEIGPKIAEGDRDPRRQPSAADRNDDRLGCGHLLRELEPDRSLARDNLRILERVDEGRAALVDVGNCGSHRVLEPLSLEDQLGPVGAAGLDLRHRRVLRDEDPRLQAGLARRPRDRLAVVAGARSNHAGLAFRVGEEREPVHSSAHLERTGALEVLGLEPDLPAGDPRQGLGAVHRRLACDARDPLACVADVSCGRGCFRQLQP